MAAYIETSGNRTYLLENGKDYVSTVLKLTSEGYTWIIPPDLDTVKFPRILHADWNKTLAIYNVEKNPSLYKQLLREKRLGKLLDD